MDNRAGGVSSASDDFGDRSNVCCEHDYCSGGGFWAKRLVIDSITAIKEIFKDLGEARSLLQNIISRVLEQLECTAIIIKEGEAAEQSFEEYVADVVVGVERTLFEDRQLRILKIETLGGGGSQPKSMLHTS